MFFLVVYFCFFNSLQQQFLTAFSLSCSTMMTAIFLRYKVLATFPIPDFSFQIQIIRAIINLNKIKEIAYTGYATLDFCDFSFEFLRGIKSPGLFVLNICATLHPHIFSYRKLPKTLRKFVTHSTCEIFYQHRNYCLAMN